jgi:hypothetical protein
MGERVLSISREVLGMESSGASVERDATQKDDETPKEPNVALWAAGVVATIGLTLFGVAKFAVTTWPDSWATRGQFGDMFGAANALFSGLALAGVVIAILLQKHELKLQRIELKATREELARSAKAQEQTEQHLRLQVSFMQREKEERESRAFIEAAPLFVIDDTGETRDSRVRFTVRNMRGSIYDVDLDGIEDSLDVRPVSLSSLARKATFHLTVPADAARSGFSFQVWFRDELNRKRLQRLTYHPSRPESFFAEEISLPAVKTL